MDNVQDKAAKTKEMPKRNFPVSRQQKFWLSDNSRGLQHRSK